MKTKTNIKAGTNDNNLKTIGTAPLKYDPEASTTYDQKQANVRD